MEELLLSRPSADPAGTPAGIYLPPASFRGVQPGEVHAARFSPPPNLRKRQYTGRRLAGIKYERKVHLHLSALYGDLYLASPWLSFRVDNRLRFCQPDGLLFLPPEGRLILVEVKYQHTADAWWQTRHLYGPVLQSIFPAALWALEACEVVKWYDPAVRFPEQLVLANEINMKTPAFKVHIWKP